MSVKLVYGDIAAGAASAATVSTSSAESISTPSLIPFGSANNRAYATLEQGVWMLDGTAYIYDGGKVAFWSSAVSDDSGAFSSPYPTITISFSSRFASSGLTLNFSGDSPCTEVGVTWYDGATVLKTDTYISDDSPFIINEAVEGYDKIVIAIRKTALPYRRAKLDSVMFGVTRTFTRQNLAAVKALQDIDISSRTLSINTLDWTVVSPDGVGFIFQQRQPVSAYDGDTLIGAFYINSADRKTATRYDVSCVDAIGTLDDEMFPDTYFSGDTTAYSLAQSIGGGFTVIMDEALKAIPVKGILSGKTRRQALQQLCFSICAVADTSGLDDGIRIFALPTAETDIGEDRIRTGGSVKQSDRVTSIKVTAHSYSTSGSGESVDIGGVTYYDTKTVTTLDNPDALASDRPNVVEITDATLVSPQVVTNVAQNVLSYYRRRITYSTKFRLGGEHVGDAVSAVTAWGDTIHGHYTRGVITLSGITVSDAEVIGNG